MTRTELSKFLTGVIGAVITTSYEKHSLWKEYSERGTEWVSKGSGLWEIVGKLDGKDICVSLWSSVIDGHKILFLEPTSNVVDYSQIETWLKEHLPRSAWTEHAPIRVNMTDANNFHNLFPRT